MKKKKLLTMLTALVLVAVVGVGATLAYLSDKTLALTNTFTVGTGATALGGTLAVTGAQTNTSDLTVKGNTQLGNGAADTIGVQGVLTLSTAEIAGASALVFEGATADGFETTLAVTDPTADRYKIHHAERRTQEDLQKYRKDYQPEPFVRTSSLRRLWSF